MWLDEYNEVAATTLIRKTNIVHDNHGGIGEKQISPEEFDPVVGVLGTYDIRADLLGKVTVLIWHPLLRYSHRPQCRFDRARHAQDRRRRGLLGKV